MNRTKTIFLSVSFLMLLLNFNSNFWGLTPDKTFYEFDTYDEGFVYGRLVRSQTDGMFSYGGFPGLNYVEKDNLRLSRDDVFSRNMLQQKGMYLTKEGIPNDFYTYRSQPGAQIMMYSLIDYMSPLSAQQTIYILKFLNALLTALVFTFFLMWVFENYGFVPAVTTFVFILLSPWITKFSYNLWWAFWSFFVPLVGMLLILGKRMADRKVLIILYALFFIKCLFTGFEFISCIGLSIFIPIAYYYYLDGKSFKNFFLFSLKAGLSCFLAVLTVVAIIIVQHKFMYGTFSAGIDELTDAYFRRSSFDDVIEIRGGIKVGGVLYALITYLRGSVFGLNGLSDIVEIPFIVFITIVFANLFLLNRLTKQKSEKRKYRALIISTVLSFFVSLTWYILFKQHAFLHPHLDYICWYMPFLLFGFISVGASLSFLIREKKKI